MGEVGEGAFMNLAVEAEGLPEENGGRGVPVGDGSDVHGPIISLLAFKYNSIMNIYMVTLKQPKRPTSET
jgi:hypothetical protein